jgi:drug/metabolite transporter (DMT)-like permease
LRAIVYVVMMILIGSLTAPTARYVVRELPIGLIPLLRFGGAGLCLLPFALRDPRFFRMLRADRVRLGLTAALCVPINQTFFLSGTRLVPTTHVALIYSSCPLLVLGLATLLRQERMLPSRLFGVLSSIAGLSIIALGNAQGGAGSVAWGDLLLVGAVASCAGYLTVGKPLVNRYGSLPVLAGTFLVGALFEIPIALATAPSWFPLPEESLTAWISLAILTFVVSTLALLFQNLAMRRLDASQVATFGNVSPLLTIGWGYVLFGERLTPTLAWGGALIFLGLLGAGRNSSVGRHPSRPGDSNHAPATRELIVEA